MKQRGFAHLVLILVLAAGLLVGGYLYKRGYLHVTSNQETKNQTTMGTSPTDAAQIVITSSSPEPTVEPEPTRKVSKDTTLPHEYLPGFNITYPNSWKISFKQFFTPDTMNFESTYFPSCHEHCMGIRLAKGSVNVDFRFDLVLDDNGELCYTKDEIKAIGDGWYEVKNQKGYFYFHYPSKYLVDPKSEMCISDDGYRMKEQTPATSNYGVLMEYPYVRGNPDSTTLNEIHSIVRSIEGLDLPQ